MGKIHGNDPTGYSYGDADALKSAATGLASAISGQTGTRASYVTTASREFRGYFSQVFVDNADVASRSASELVNALQSLSGFVEQLREAAKQEDDRRAKAKAWEARKKEREDNLFVAATHEVGTWFGADDNPKPPEPEPEPHRQADAVTVSGRTIPGRDPARSRQRHQPGVLTCKKSSSSRPWTASGSRLSSGAKWNDRSSSRTVTMH
jgi:uncharacterized protein YukE